MPSTREPDPDNAGGGIATTTTLKTTTTAPISASPGKSQRHSKPGGFVLRTIIFANGHFDQSFMPHPDDLIIAADGGANHCLAIGVDPEAVIGDLDSLDDQQIGLLESRGVTIIRYPTHKDYTDLELALGYAFQRGADEIIILAALGARWDQTIANLLLPAAYPSTRISLIDKNQEFHYIHSGTQLEIQGRPKDLISLVPLKGDAHGITTRGLAYPLDAETLYFGNTRGISNVLLGDKATIYLKEGLLLCTILHLD